MNTAEIDRMDSASPDLLVRAQSGDAHSFCQLCGWYRERLVRQALTLCRETGSAEDLAQETFIEAWKNLKRFRGQSQFYTWLCAILLNRYRNSMRRRRPLPLWLFSAEEQQRLSEAAGDLHDPGDLPDVVAGRNDRAECVARLLERLSPKLRDVIFLRFYVDDSLEGIAAALGCSLGTVKSRLYYALEQLRGMDELQKLMKERN